MNTGLTESKIRSFLNNYDSIKWFVDGLLFVIEVKPLIITAILLTSQGLYIVSLIK